MAVLGAQQQGAAAAAWLADLRTLPAIYAQQARRQASGVGYCEMVMNSRDLEEYEGGTVDGARYTNASKFSRMRGGAW
jgi:hypothetical protein